MAWESSWRCLAYTLGGGVTKYEGRLRRPSSTWLTAKLRTRTGWYITNSRVFDAETPFAFFYLPDMETALGVVWPFAWDSTRNFPYGLEVYSDTGA